MVKKSHGFHGLMSKHTTFLVKIFIHEINNFRCLIKGEHGDEIYPGNEQTGTHSFISQFANGHSIANDPLDL